MSYGFDEGRSLQSSSQLFKCPLIFARTSSGFSIWTLWLAPSTTKVSALDFLEAITLEFSIREGQCLGPSIKLNKCATYQAGKSNPGPPSTTSIVFAVISSKFLV